jgi:hypothetical protein
MATDWGSLAQLGLSLASNYSQGRQQAQQGAQVMQQQQNAQGIAQNQGQNNVLLQMAQIELLRKQMEEQNRPQRAQATGLGDALANVQDVNISRPSHISNFSISGGLRPSMLGPNTRAAGAELSNQSLAALQGGDSFMPLNPAGPINLDATMPEESGFDKIMALAGTAGNVYQGYQQQQQQQAAQAQSQQSAQQNAENFRRLLELFGGQQTQPVRPPNG